MADETPELPIAGTRRGSPLARLTQVHVDEPATLRMWEGIESRLTRRRGASWSRARIELRWVLAAVATLLLGTAGALRWFQTDAPQERAAAGAAGPLLTGEGRAFESLDATAAASAQRVSFADGSSLEASPGARIEGLASTSSEFALFLRQGRVRVSVTPHGLRRWTLETRGARIEVVGTMFSVQSAPGRVDIEVEKGVVLVRSPFLPDGVQRLDAGGVLAIDTQDARGAGPVGAVSSESAAPIAASGAAPGTRSASTASAARDVRPRASAAELWKQADGARTAGDSARAAAILQQLLDNHPRDAQASLAAFTLGVLELEQLDRPAPAASSFRRAIQLGVTGGLLESSHLRLGEALHRSGDVAGLRAVLEQYNRRFPNGRHRTRLERWIEETP